MYGPKPLVVSQTGITRVENRNFTARAYNFLPKFFAQSLFKVAQCSHGNVFQQVARLIIAYA